MLALLWVWFAVSVLAIPVSGFVGFAYAHDDNAQAKAGGWFIAALVAFVSALTATGFLIWWYIVSGLVWFVLLPIGIFLLPLVIWLLVTGAFRDLFMKLLTWVKYAKP